MAKKSFSLLSFIWDCFKFLDLGGTFLNRLPAHTREGEEALPAATLAVALALIHRHFLNPFWKDSTYWLNLSKKKEEEESSPHQAMCSLFFLTKATRMSCGSAPRNPHSTVVVLLLPILSRRCNFSSRDVLATTSKIPFYSSGNHSSLKERFMFK